jgi:hypothetical protein
VKKGRHSKAKLAKYRTAPELFAEEIAQAEKQLSGEAKPISWHDLSDRFGAQHELAAFATKVWAERGWGGKEMAENPAKLTEMFLYRELFRRPHVQNNAETMGLVRLTFPAMETKACLVVPRALQEAGVDAEGWAGLAQAAADLVFRDSLAINIADGWMVRWVAPHWGRLQAIASPGIAPEDRLPGSRPWPGPNPNPSNPSRLILLIYRLIGGSALAVGKMTVAEPNPPRSPCRQRGGDAPLHSLPPLSTANRGVTCCAKAPLTVASAPAVIAKTHLSLRDMVIICLPTNSGPAG